MTTKELRFSEGSSNKFWRITLDGATHTIVYGRIGSDGQTQTKEFADESEARRAFDKLVGEKVKKGYAEAGAASTGEAATAAAPARAPRAAKAEPEPPARASLESVAPTAERSIALEPDDWRWATWRRIPPVPRPEPRPFDLDRALKQFSKVTVNKYGYRYSWTRAAIEPSLTREEAHFWFEAFAAVYGTLGAGSSAPPLPKIAEKLAGTTFTGEVDRAALRAAFGFAYQPPVEFYATCANLVSPATFVAIALEREAETRAAATRGYYSGPYQVVVDAFRRHIMPHLSDEDTRAMRELVRPALSPAAWAALGAYVAPPLAFVVAAALGMSDELQPVIESWPDDNYKADPSKIYYQQPLPIIFGLDDPKLVEAHVRRLSLRLDRADHLRAWLAHTEYSALDKARDSILAQQNKEDSAALFDVLALVRAPEAAPYVLELMLSSKTPRGARDWLDANPAHAVEGLVPLAGGRGRLADAAADYLRTVLRRGGEHLIAAAVERQAAEIADRVRAVVLERDEPEYVPFDDATTPEWLRTATGEPALKKAKSPQWIGVEDLPPLSVGTHRLDGAQTETVLRALAIAKPDAVPALIGALKANADPMACDLFAWTLFERWLSNGAPSKDGWALRAVGLLGGDASVLRLAPMIRAWPGESQHQRAVAGLEVLRAIGTDAALMQINGIAQKVPFKALKARAAGCLEEIAAERGLTRAQLEDRIVPDCGLDERGSRVFDFGARRFEFLLGADMKPMVREPGGKPRPDLPKPGAKDDAAIASSAVAEWKLLKKQVAEVAKIQATRLEQAMVTGRRWPRDEFERLLVAHPLMRHLVRLVVWGAYDDAGGLAGTFRVTEDETYADERDETFDLGASASVGIVHPLSLAPELRAAWGEVLGDYEIVPPFPQLGRPVLALEGDEPAAREIVRFKPAAIPPQALVFTLEKLGWARGIPEDAGVFCEHSKPFYGANVTAVVEYYGVPVGYMEGWDDQHIDRCFFVPGIYTPEMYPNHKDAIVLGEVDAVAVSEVLADLSLIASKGK